MTEAQTQTSHPATTSQPDKSRALQPIAQLKSGLEQMRSQLLLQLPEHVKVDRFIRICVTAVNNNPDLLAADRRSFYNACLRAASDGLMPDGREGALAIFKDSNNKKLVQWMPMVNGLIKLIRQSGEIDSIGARIVYQNEIDQNRFRFIVDDGEEKLFHEPMLWGERGEKALAYAYARYKESGHVEYLPMHKTDILQRKAASRAKSGPWQTWESEMWLKTAIRALAKRLPISSDLLNKIDKDEEPSEFEKLRDEAVATASAQLGAQPLIETGGMEDAPPLHDEPPEPEPEDQTEQMVTAMVYTAISALEPDHDDEEGKTSDELDEFAEHIRLNIRQQPISDTLRDSLLHKFNAAVTDKRKTFAKSR